MSVFAPPIFAAALVLTLAAAGSGDYELVAPGRPNTCAKSAANCELAREAIRRGWIEGTVPSVCKPSPGCFSPASNVIQGFNDPATMASRR